MNTQDHANITRPTMAPRSRNRADQRLFEILGLFMTLLVEIRSCTILSRDLIFGRQAIGSYPLHSTIQGGERSQWMRRWYARAVYLLSIKSLVGRRRNKVISRVDSCHVKPSERSDPWAKYHHIISKTSNMLNFPSRAILDPSVIKRATQYPCWTPASVPRWEWLFKTAETLKSMQIRHLRYTYSPFCTRQITDATPCRTNDDRCLDYLVGA